MENIQTAYNLKTILVTSTRTNGNGSSVAADLAALIARSGNRVALMDADFRQPMIHNLYNLPNQTGLMDLLHGDGGIPDLMHSVNGNHLFVLTAGINKNGRTDPFASERMTELLTSLKNTYERVIIHGAPFFQSEILTLAGKVDGVVILIQPNNSRAEATRALMGKFQKSGAKIIGVIMRDQPKYQNHQSVFIDRLLSYDRHARLAL